MGQVHVVVLRQNLVVGLVEHGAFAKPWILRKSQEILLGDMILGRLDHFALDWGTYV